MPEPHDVHQPTARMPVVEPRGVYRAADPRRTALIAAGVSAVVLVGLVVWLFSGGDDEQPAAPPVAVASAPVEPVTEATTTEPAAEPTTTPAATPATAPTTAPVTVREGTPAEWIAGLISAVNALEDQDRLDDDAAEALNRRLEQAAGRLRRGDVKGASRKIDEFGKKLADLRKDDDVSKETYDLLRAAAKKVRDAIPRR